MRIWTFLLIFLGFTLARGSEIYWPASARIPSKLHEAWIMSDHMRVKTYTVSVAGGKVEISYMAKFAVGEPYARWNTTFVIPEQPAIRWGIAGFAKGDFLPAVTPEVIQRYIAGLTATGAKDIQSSALGTFDDTLMICGFKPEIVEYTSDKIRRREYFVEYEGKIFVFGYEAPESLFGSKSEIVRIIFSRVRLLS